MSVHKGVRAIAESRGGIVTRLNPLVKRYGLSAVRQAAMERRAAAPSDALADRYERILDCLDNAQLRANPHPGTGQRKGLEAIGYQTRKLTARAKRRGGRVIKRARETSVGKAASYAASGAYSEVKESAYDAQLSAKIAQMEFMMRQLGLASPPPQLQALYAERKQREGRRARAIAGAFGYQIVPARAAANPMARSNFFWGRKKEVFSPQQQQEQRAWLDSLVGRLRRSENTYFLIHAIGQGGAGKAWYFLRSLSQGAMDSAGRGVQPVSYIEDDDPRMQVIINLKMFRRPEDYTVIVVDAFTRQVSEPLTLEDLYTRSTLPNPRSRNNPSLEQLSDKKDFHALLDVLALLYAIRLHAQAAHWSARGSDFYSDHLMWERIYKSTDKAIDTVGEQMIYAFNLDDMSARVLARKVAQHQETLQREAASGHLRCAILLEQAVLAFIDTAHEALRQDSHLSRALENMLMNLAEERTRILYLLSRRHLT